MKNKTVVVGMSGGVDSSVAAYLLKQQGYRVIGVTMQIWQQEAAETIQENGGCCGLSAVEDAQRVAQQLDIPHYVMNFRKEFQENVIDYFVREYRAGRTPNPCIACNRHVKWETLLDRSIAIGADYIATGHYARIRRLDNGRYTIVCSESAGKDQTYALYNLTQEQLRRTLFPAGEYEKSDIRKIAEEAGLTVAHKPDSQEICFIPDHDHAAFIERETGKKEPAGNFVNEAGEVLGRHRGISHYTIGQRKGLGIAFGEPVFVTEIRPDTDEVVLGRADAVFSDRLTASGMHYMAVDHLEAGQRVLAKIRYSHAGAMATVEKADDDGLKLVFDEPVRAVTPGQAVVLYDQGMVLGGGTISRR